MAKVGRWLRTLASLTPPVVLSIVLAIAGLLLVRDNVSVETLRASNDEVGNYLQTLGTIYAVLLAFVVFVVWGQFNDVRTLAEREANELLDLYRTARAFPPDARAAILRELRAYAADVAGREWGAMKRMDDPVLDENRSRSATVDGRRRYRATTSRRCGASPERANHSPRAWHR